MYFFNYLRGNTLCLLFYLLCHLAILFTISEKVEYKLPEYCADLKHFNTERAIPPLKLDSTFELENVKLEQVIILGRHGARTPLSLVKHWETVQNEWNCTYQDTYYPFNKKASIFSVTNLQDESDDKKVTHLEQSPKHKFSQLFSVVYDTDVENNILHGTCKRGQLIEIGALQHCKNGFIIQDAYFHKLFSIQSDNYDTLFKELNDGIYVRSTNTQRTLQSSVQLMNCAINSYLKNQVSTTTQPPTTTQPSTTTETTTSTENSTTASTTEAISTTTGNTESVKSTSQGSDSDNSDSNDTTRLLSRFMQEFEEQDEEDESSVQNKRLRDIKIHSRDGGNDILEVNMTDEDAMILKSNAMNSDQFHHLIDAQTTLRKDIFNVTKVEVSETFFLTSFFDSVMARVCNNRLYDLPEPFWPRKADDRSTSKNLLELFIDAVEAGQSLIYLFNKSAYSRNLIRPLIKEYNQLIKNAQKTQPKQKLILYLSHDATLAPFLASFNDNLVYDEHWIPYASTINLELYSVASHDKDGPSSSLYFRMVYNGKVISQNLPHCKATMKGELCPIDAWFESTNWAYEEPSTESPSRVISNEQTKNGYGNLFLLGLFLTGGVLFGLVVLEYYHRRKSIEHQWRLRSHIDDDML